MTTILSETRMQGFSMSQGASRSAKNMLNEVDLWMGAGLPLEALSYTDNCTTS